MRTPTLQEIRSLVRDVPDFPKKGIIFKDISPVLAHPGALSVLCASLAEPFQGQKIDKVLAVESRGFLFGAGIAERLGAGLVPVRKAGKLPWRTIQESYALEYGEAMLEIHSDAVAPNERVLLVDDVLATGGTLKAARNLAAKLGGEVVGASLLIEIGFLQGRRALELGQVHALWSV